MFAAIIYSIRIESCFTSFDKIYLEIIEEVSTMTSFRISTGILSDTSMKTMKIADRMQDISREVGLVNRNLHGCFPEESIAALRLSDFSASLDVLSGKMHGFHRAMDDCAASYVNAEEQLRLILNSLYMIANDKRPTELVKCIFELRLMTISGYVPDLVCCRDCRCFRQSHRNPLLKRNSCCYCSPE